ncbi:MAG: hypothetical protein COA70_07905 [Planctomycetota bacterium]|nr:MAG: hypothetical protein COA70_07905 [Planctomycetota bacterium]
MLFSTLVFCAASLAAPVQLPDSLPEIGTETALNAQEDFREWSSSKLGNMTEAVHLDYVIEMNLRVVDGQRDGVVAVHLDYQCDILSLSVQRHLLVGSLEVESVEYPFEMEFLLDGTDCWFRLSVEAFQNLEFFSEGNLLAKGDQKALEDLYAVYLEVLPALSSADFGDVDLSSMSGFMQRMMEVSPPSVEIYAHPSGMVHYSCKVLTCRSMTRENGKVDVYLSLDVQPGSYIGDLFLAARPLLLSTGMEESGIDQGYQILQSMGELVGGRFRFDEETGVPLDMWIDLMIEPADFGFLDEEGSLAIVASITGEMTRPQFMDEKLFEPLTSSIPPIDLTVFIQGAQVILQQMMDEMNSADDLDF